MAQSKESNYSDQLKELLRLTKDVSYEERTGMYRGVTPRLEEIVRGLDLAVLIEEINSIIDRDTKNYRRTPISLASVVMVCTRLQPLIMKNSAGVNNITISLDKNPTLSDDAGKRPQASSSKAKKQEIKQPPAEALSGMMANLSIPMEVGDATGPLDVASQRQKERSGVYIHGTIPPRGQGFIRCILHNVGVDRPRENTVELSDPNNNEIINELNNEIETFEMHMPSTSDGIDESDIYRRETKPRRATKSRARSPDLPWVKDFKVRKLAHNSKFNMVLHHAADDCPTVPLSEADDCNTQQDEARALPEPEEYVSYDFTDDSNDYLIASIQSRIDHIKSLRSGRPYDFLFTLVELTPYPQVAVSKIITWMALDKLDKEGAVKFYRKDTLSGCYALFNF